jgi:hypothetical protein
MLVYVLKSAACLAIFLAFYTFFMEKENMHTLKRFYLLGAMVAALTIPFVTFVEYVEIPVPSEAIMEVIDIPAVSGHVQEQTPIEYLPSVLWGIYLLGALLYGFKFVRNLAAIIQRIHNNPKYTVKRITNVLLGESVVPHTFLSYIFFNKQKFETHQIPEEVLLHEKTHAKQKHSWDVLFIEFLQVIFWFNPLIYHTKKAIKLNHEFLADRAVLNKGYKPSTYQNTLLEFSSNSLHPQLANAINYSSIKKRFTVMKTQTSKRSVLLRSLFFLPLLSILLFAFSSRAEIQIDSSVNEIRHKGASPKMIAEYNTLAKKYNTTELDMKLVKQVDLRRMEQVFRIMTPAQRKSAEPLPPLVASPRVQDIATKAQVKDYNTLAKKYNAMSRDNFIVIGKEVKQLQHIYGHMTEQQRRKAEPYPNFPPPPSSPAAVKGDIIEIPSPSSNPKVPNVEIQEVTPPPLPPIKPPTDRNKYSDELLDAFDKLMEEGNLYGQAGSDYSKKGKGSVKDLQQKYEEVMKLYKHYVKLAVKENLMPSSWVTPKIKKGDRSNIPPPPPPSHVDGEIIEVPRPSTVPVIHEGEISDIPPPPPPVSPAINKGEIKEVPPPPPSPKSPKEHMMEMAEKDAVFYYEGKEISSDKAIKILKKSKKINLRTRHEGLKRPIVELSTSPIIIE